MYRKSLRCLPVVATILALAPAMQAQRAGWQVAIAKPVIQSPVQPIINAPVQPFLPNGAQLPGIFGFGVAPPITPPVITTSYSSIFSRFPADHQPRAVVVPQPQVIYVSATPVPAFGCAYAYGCGGYGNNAGTVIVPNGTVITNSTVIVQQTSGQNPYFGPGAIVQQTPRFVPPAVGTPREEVIRRCGTPVTTMYTQKGETLYFSGGGTVLIQNGKVATPQ
jgi:hypothetical protein